MGRINIKFLNFLAVSSLFGIVFMLAYSANFLFAETGNLNIIDTNSRIDYGMNTIDKNIDQIETTINPPITNGTNNTIGETVNTNQDGTATFTPITTTTTNTNTEMTTEAASTGTVDIDTDPGEDPLAPTDTTTTNDINPERTTVDSNTGITNANITVSTDSTKSTVDTNKESIDTNIGQNGATTNTPVTTSTTADSNKTTVDTIIRTVDTNQDETTSPAITTTVTTTDTNPEKTTLDISNDQNSETNETTVDVVTYPTQKTIICDEADIKDPKKCNIYIFELRAPEECKGHEIETQNQCTNFIFLDNAPDICKNNSITTKDECNKLIETEKKIETENSFIYQDCTKKGITDPEECNQELRKNYLNFKSTLILIQKNNQLPIECQERNVLNKDDCEKFIFKDYGPEICKQNNIGNIDECEKLVFENIAPADCRKAQISDFESCNEFMFQKFSNIKSISQNQFPIECKTKNAISLAECQKIIRAVYMPKQCTINGIQDANSCELLLNITNITKECQANGIKSKIECNEYMFKGFGLEECQKTGITNQEECKDYIFNKYISKINCGNIESWQCKKIIQERYLGEISNKQATFEKIKINQEELNNKSLSIDDLKKEIDSEIEISPFKETTTGIKIIQSKSDLTLNQNEELIQLSPIALMIDTDLDGIPDDIEKRIGTDPNNKDTDQDGYGDMEEVKKGYNPSGEGLFEKSLSPIERAIFNNVEIEHPKDRGQESDNFQVNNIDNLNDKTNNTDSGYTLKGIATPNSTITIYIYSDLPIIVTAETDEYGNWKYEMKESLVDGEHEVYVAINDETGKIINKSKPFNLFINKAEAVSVKDFINPPKDNSSSRESDLSMFYYRIISLLLIIIGLLAFLIFVIKKNNKLSNQ